MPITDPCVVRLLAEGGLIEVFGRKEPDGSWTFIGRWGSLDFDDSGNDSVRTGGVPTSKDLGKFLPTQWTSLNPRKVHPELREWFRSRYEEAVAALPADRQESHLKYHHYKWQAMFDSTTPDRWSEEDDF